MYRLAGEKVGSANHTRNTQSSKENTSISKTAWTITPYPPPNNSQGSQPASQPALLCRPWLAGPCNLYISKQPSCIVNSILTKSSEDTQRPGRLNNFITTTDKQSLVSVACERGCVRNDILREINPINREGYKESINVRRLLK